MVAFHFQFSNQDGWKCDVCRKSGLDRKRRCGWLGFGDEPGTPPVWAREQVSLATCPKSYITGESLTFVEDYFVHRCAGEMDPNKLSAREADAFVILEEAVAKQIRDGQQNSRTRIGEF